MRRAPLTSAHPLHSEPINFHMHRTILMLRFSEALRVLSFSLSDQMPGSPTSPPHQQPALALRWARGAGTGVATNRKLTSMHSRHLPFLLIFPILLTVPMLQGAWWERPHAHWHVKDDWKAAAVTGFSHSMTLLSPASSGWIVIWGDQGVELTVNNSQALKNPSPLMIYDSDLTALIRGARQIQLHAGPGRIVAEGELIDELGRIYPFASGCDWPAPVPGGKATLPPASTAHRPSPRTTEGPPPPFGRPLLYNAEERGKNHIARTLARVQRLREQSIFLLRRLRHADHILNFDPDTLWRRAERFANQPILEAEHLLLSEAIPAQNRRDFEAVTAIVQQAGIKLSAAELALSSARTLYQCERQLSHLEACLHLIREADLQPLPLDPHFAEIRAFLRAAQQEARLDDWAGVEKQIQTAQPRLDSLQGLLSMLWGQPISPLDEFPNDPLGWLNHPSLMGNDPTRWAFSLLPSESDVGNSVEIQSVTTPGPLSFTTEYVLQDGNHSQSVTLFSSAMSPGVVVASDQPFFRLRGWETRRHALPSSIAFVTSGEFQAVPLLQTGFSLDGATLSASWLVLGPGFASPESGLSETRPTVLVMEQRPRSVSWETNQAGHFEFNITFDQAAGRMMIFTPPADDPPWSHQEAFVRAQTLRSVPVACSQLVRLHRDRQTADYLLRYHYLELQDFAGQGSLRVAPVPMLVAYAFDHEYPGLSSRGFSTTSYRSDHTQYRLRLFWETFDYTLPFSDPSQTHLSLAAPHLTPAQSLVQTADSNTAWFHRIEPIGPPNDAAVFEDHAMHPVPYRDVYYPSDKASPETVINALLDPILHSIRSPGSLQSSTLTFSPVRPGTDHLRQLQDLLFLFNRFGIQWSETSWQEPNPLANDAALNENPARTVLRSWHLHAPASSP
jgi:hypothetical protein